jgi:hypothetical protein
VNDFQINLYPNRQRAQMISLVICLFDKNSSTEKKEEKKNFNKKKRNEIWRKAGRGSACKRVKSHIQTTISN